MEVNEQYNHLDVSFYNVSTVEIRESIYTATSLAVFFIVFLIILWIGIGIMFMIIYANNGDHVSRTDNLELETIEV